MRNLFIILSLIMVIPCSLYSARLNGKWKSTTANTIYLYEDSANEIRVQVVLKSGETYTWQGQWLKKRKIFYYQNKIDKYKATIENVNTIIVTGEKENSIYVWRRAHKIKKKRRAAKRRKKAPSPNYTYYYPSKPKTVFRPEDKYLYKYALVGWSHYNKDSRQLYSQSKSTSRISVQYGGIDKNGPWLGLVIPILSLEKSNWGLTVIFVRSNGKWQLRYMRPMKIVRNGSNKIDWLDAAKKSIPIKATDSWKLKVGDNNLFYFEYYGDLYLGNNRYINKIKIKGKSTTLTQ